jgi:hypothetical protein
VSAGDPNASDPFDPVIDWVGFAQDTFDGLGTHSALCGAVAAVTETLRAELAAATAALRDEVAAATAALRGELAAVTEALRSHTHVYLTGRGAGHNDVRATTGPATIPE